MRKAPAALAALAMFLPWVSSIEADAVLQTNERGVVKFVILR
jgi:hypothetical protein